MTNLTKAIGYYTIIGKSTATVYDAGLCSLNLNPLDDINRYSFSESNVTLTQNSSIITNDITVKTDYSWDCDEDTEIEIDLITENTLQYQAFSKDGLAVLASIFQDISDNFVDDNEDTDDY